PLDTRNILFICAGAFDGLDKIIARRVNKQAIGYRSSNELSTADQAASLLSQVSPVDLRHYGLIPELLGRLPVLVNLEPLDRSTLLSILTQPKNALVRQYEHQFALEGMALSFTPEALDEIVSCALDLKLGARGLRSIMEAALGQAMFEWPGADNRPESLVVDKDFVQSKLQAAGLLVRKAS
ncbi:MAG: ATP-dependent Clp protease ATP-binding subunit ClpX, partial [Bacteroidia bacterium]